jgi:hypothetical protein
VMPSRSVAAPSTIAAYGQVVGTAGVSPAANQEGHPAL